MEKTAVESVVQAAGGPGGSVVVRFRDFLTPILNEDGTAAKELTPELDDEGNYIVDDEGNVNMIPEGPVVHELHPLGHVRVTSGIVVKVIDNHLALGPSIAGPIQHLIAFDDIEHVTPDFPAMDIPPLPPAVGALHDA
jgi:hypothetical protein